MEDINLNVNNSSQPEPGKKMGLLQRIIGVVLSPGEVMINLVQYPRVLFPVLLMSLSTVVLYVTRFSLYKDFLRETLEKSLPMMQAQRGIEMTPEMIDKSVDFQAIIALISTPIASIVMWLIITAILFGLLKAFKGEGSYKQYLSVIGHAYVISTLYLIIVEVVSFFTGSLHLDLPLTSIANVFPSSMKGTFTYGIIKGIDLFSIWYYAVMGIGLCAVSKLSKTKVYAIIGIIFIGLLLFGGYTEFKLGQLM